VASVLAAGLAGIGGQAVPAAAADKNPPNPATVLAARTYPGVQLIQTDYTATLSVPSVIVNQAAVQRATRRLVAQALTGAIDTTESALREALVDDIAKNPFDFFKPSKSRETTQSSLTGVGTGWVATPDGYIVTAAHVVKADPDEIKAQFAATALDKLTKESLKGLVSGDSAGKYTNDQLVRLSKAITTWYERYLTVSGVKTSVSVQVGVATAGYKKSQRGQPVEVVSVGESYPGKDVAILKLDGESQLPTLPIGTNDEVSEGSTLYVAGYPAASTFYSGLSKDSQVQPTVTQGPLTAIKSSAKGTPVFQTQAPASPGNSGGPVLDADGRVVGILVASAVDDKGVALEGQGFVVPASVITEKLREKNVSPRMSETTKLYDEAVNEYYKHWYKPALEKFQKVSNLYPGHPYVGDFTAKSQAAINAGKDETPIAKWVWGLVAFAVLFVIGAAVGTILLIARSRRRKPGPAGAPGTYPGQPPYAPAALAGQQQSLGHQQPYPGQPPYAGQEQYAAGQPYQGGQPGYQAPPAPPEQQPYQGGQPGYQAPPAPPEQQPYQGGQPGYQAPPAPPEQQPYQGGQPGYQAPPAEPGSGPADPAGPFQSPQTGPGTDPRP
jgi:serine protease Do